MPGYFGNEKGSKMYLGDIKIGQAYMGRELVYQSAFAVTYHVDTANIYTEPIVPGESALNPATFTPEKNGWDFKGWRLDTTADGEVESNLTATEPISLYAVFERDIAIAFNSHESEVVSSSKIYYNNGNSSKASVSVPTGAERADWTWRGWSAAGVTSANATVTYNNGDTIDGLDSDSIFYGLYEQTITKTFVSYESSKQSSGVRYYNASGNSTKASIVVPEGTVYDGWIWRGWGALDDKAADAEVEFSNGHTMNAESGGTYYGLYSATVTASYDGNGGTGSVPAGSGTKYWNAAGNILGATITLEDNEFAKKNCSFSKWSQGSVSGTQYDAGSDVVITSNTTFYAVWSVNALNRKVWKSGSGVGDWSGSYDFTNYSTVTLELEFNKCYRCVLEAISPVEAYDEGGSNASITFTPQSGSQSIEWGAQDKEEYGIYASEMTWKLYITAS